MRAFLKICRFGMGMTGQCEGFPSIVAVATLESRRKTATQRD